MRLMKYNSEIFVSRRKDKEQYITIVRDLETGAVLYVGKGKGFEAMDAFNSSLKHSKAKLCAVSIRQLAMSSRQRRL